MEGLGQLCALHHSLGRPDLSAHGFSRLLGLAVRACAVAARHGGGVAAVLSVRRSALAAAIARGARGIGMKLSATVKPAHIERMVRPKRSAPEHRPGHPQGLPLANATHLKVTSGKKSTAARCQSGCTKAEKGHCGKSRCKHSYLGGPSCCRKTRPAAGLSRAHCCVC